MTVGLRRRKSERVRVVSLVPSVTETLLAWGVEPVACTRFCEQPQLRHVGGTKDPDVDAIVALRPDLVVVDREENRKDDADALVAAGVHVHVTHVTALSDVAPTLAELAAAVGATSATDTSSSPSAAVEAVRRRAYVPIWRRPWMTLNGATYGASLLAAAGIDTVYADHPERYPTIALQDVAQARPDVVLLPSEPYPFTERHLAEVETAVGVPVHLVDGKDLFWWGVRSPGALVRFAELARSLG